MKILLAASEVAPIVKIGGLGDVTGSLPKTLEKLGVNVDVIVPFFSYAKIENIKLYKSIEFEVDFAGESNLVQVYNTKLPDSNVDVILLKNLKYFGNVSTDYFAKTNKETEVFSFFCKCVVEFIKSRFNTYDLIHCNDWHTGLVTHLLEDEIGNTRPATLLTIHNLLYQGIGDLELVKRVGIVPGTHPIIDWDIADGDINFMQQGISSADFINTVSPSYAHEIMTEEYGGGLNEILKSREGRVAGILNGVNYKDYPRNFNAGSWVEGKKIQKIGLQKRLGLEPDLSAPIFSFIGRIDAYQKGVELVHKIAPKISKLGGQVIFLGVGDKKWEAKLSSLAKDGQISTNLSFDLDLANQIYAGSDFMLLPSRYEPCGLVQIISMWYGTVPVVRETGGLKDTVTDEITGFVFKDYSAESFFKSIKSAFGSYHDKESHSKMVVNALGQDFSWDISAQKYRELYEKVINIRKESIK